MLRVVYYDGSRLQDVDCRMDDTIKHHYYPEWSVEEEGEDPSSGGRTLLPFHPEKADRVHRVVALEREYLDSKLQKYKKSVVFQEGAWICLPQEVRLYMKVLKENDIPWDKVVFMEKYGDYHRR